MPVEVDRQAGERAADGGQLGWPVGSEGDRAEFAKFGQAVGDRTGRRRRDEPEVGDVAESQ